MSNRYRKKTTRIKGRRARKRQPIQLSFTETYQGGFYKLLSEWRRLVYENSPTDSIMVSIPRLAGKRHIFDILKSMEALKYE